MENKRNIKTETNTTLSKPEIGRIYRVEFYDHSDNENAENIAIRPEACILELFGELVGIDDIYLRVKVINATLAENSLFWNIVKSTIIELEEL